MRKSQRKKTTSGKKSIYAKNLYMLIIKQNNLTCTQNMTGTRERTSSGGKNMKNIKIFFKEYNFFKSFDCSGSR